MSNQDPDKFDDDFSDIDVSDEAFVEDFDLPDDDDLGMPVDDTELDYVEDDFMDDGWDDDLYGTPEENLIAKEKKSYDVNKIAIAAALVVGVCVLGYQIYANRPEAVAHFKTALSMTGATDGPIFGKDKENVEEPETLKIEKGFLDDPAVIDPQESPQDTNTPPMPVPIAQDQPGEPEETLTPMPVVEGFVDVVSEDGTQVPRTPDAFENNDSAEPSENKAQALLEKTLAERSGEQTQTSLLGESDNQETGASFGFDNSLEGSLEPEENNPLLGDKEDLQDDTNIITKIRSTPIKDKQIIRAEKEQTETTLSASEEQEQTAAPVQETKEVTPQTEQTDQTSEREQEREEDIAVLKEEIAELKAELEKSRAREQKQSVDTATPKTTAPVSTSPAAVQTQQTAKAPQTSASSSGRWVLRAAQPGKAWVSRSGQRDMQSLVVGDTLHGIGRITEIAHRNGRWIVQGTQGRIDQ